MLMIVDMEMYHPSNLQTIGPGCMRLKSIFCQTEHFANNAKAEDILESKMRFKFRLHGSYYLILWCGFQIFGKVLNVCPF